MTSASLSIAALFATIGCLAGCGAAGSTPTPSTPTVGAAQLATAPPSLAATPQTNSGPGGSAAALSVTPPDSGSARPNPLGAAAGEQETFPSGLVIDAKIVGGPGPGPELPRGTRILHLGDSFAGALGAELSKVFVAAGIKSRLEFEQSTYIPTWAHGGKVAGLLARFKPDLVIISLGANELEIPEPEKRGPLIQRLVKSLGDTPCVWVAPVLWQGAKRALLDVIRANVGSCVYLDSNELVKKMPRAADKIHPSMVARPDWATATARWLAYHRKPTESKLWNIAAAP